MATGTSTGSFRRRCYYCHYETSDVQLCVDHVVKDHGDELLKIKIQAIDAITGNAGLLTNNFNIVPKDVLQKGEWFQVDESDWTLQVVPLIDDQVENAFLDMSLDDDDIGTWSPCNKKLKCSSPNMDIRGPGNIEHEKELETALTELTELLPDVLCALKKNGQLQTWLKLNRMISAGTFPHDNLAFLLFMDVCKFFSCNNTTSMRYDERVRRFWRIGYRLFHAKWLRFMSGPKHLGQILTKQTDKRIFEPCDSLINFAVSFRSIVSSDTSPHKYIDTGPCLLSYLMDKLAEQSNVNKTYKLCFDGKKINASTSGKEGDIDLWGLEHTPSLSERRSALQKEEIMIEESSSLLKKMLSLSKCFLSDSKEDV